MGRLVSFLFALSSICLCLHQATSTCNFDVIRSLWVLRGDEEDSGILDSLAQEGHYQLAYVTIGQLSPLLNSERCLAATFGKTSSGYQVKYSGVGTFTLAYNLDDNAIDVLGDDGQSVNKYYVIFNTSGVVALYSCDPSSNSNNFSVGSVFVAESALASTKSKRLVAKAIKTMAEVGVRNGLKIAPCQQAAAPN